ncbi:MAG: hypothetical protein R6X02_26070 [Enhygromyxa sp.]
MAEPSSADLRIASVELARLSLDSTATLGWPHVVVGRERDRPLARFVVGASGLILGASTGMFVGGMLGVLLAMALLPLLPQIAVGLLVVTTVTCGSAGAVVGTRVLQRETFDEVP